jgi:hypothetical protein
MGAAVFKCRPTSEEVTAALDRIMSAEQVQPKHLIVDQGPEFNCEHFKDVWCKSKNIPYRFGAVSRLGSIAVVERFHSTMKEILRLIVVPEDQSRFEHEVECIIDWYNEARPHMTLNGKTPNEVYFSREPANERLRIEPRPRWPRGSPCAKPPIEIDGAPARIAAGRSSLCGRCLDHGVSLSGAAEASGPTYCREITRLSKQTRIG